MRDEFFGSKLNTVLLFVLIILMVVAIKIMLKDKETYFPFFSQQKTEQNQDLSSGVLGNKDDLVSFSVSSGERVSGLVPYKGAVKGGYFFEANILINILDANKKRIKAGHATATGEWMTAEPVSFEGKLDFTGLPKGSAYIEIHNDNASGLPEYDKSILIPVVIE